MRAKCFILEGSWDRATEAPKVLPHVQALAATSGRFEVSHRTIRCADDVAFWIKKIPKGSRSLVYFACHGSGLDLVPVGERSRIQRQELIEALKGAKEGAIAFLHFGCCEMVDSARRHASLKELALASQAYWVSGYTKEIDWLQSTMLDLALIGELYLAFARAGLKRGPKLQKNASQYLENYNDLARRLGFSGLSYLSESAGYRLYPQRLRDRKAAR